MPKYDYRARDQYLKLDQGSIEAPSVDELVRSLQGRGYLVTLVTRTIPAARKGRGEKKEKVSEQEVVFETKEKLHRGVRIDDLSLFARQLSALLSAGVTLLRGLNILLRQTESRSLHLALEEVREDIKEGMTFKDALSKHSKIFSRFWVDLVGTGEASGQLPSCLEELARYLEASSALRRKIVSAMIYPIILICVIILAISIFLFKVIPIFENLFQGFDIELPVLTKVIIALSAAARHYFPLVFAGFLVIWLLFRKYIHTEGGGLQFDKFKLKLPVIGNLIRNLAIARFSSGLGTLINAGVPILYALEIVSKITGSKVLEKSLEEVKLNVREGKSMGEPLSMKPIFPPMVAQMVTVGEETGELGNMLGRINDFYEERVSVSVARLTSMFEPILIVFMGIVVGIIVISMFMPIFQISQIGM